VPQRFPLALQTLLAASPITLIMPGGLGRLRPWLPQKNVSRIPIASIRL
jgi:hypothetical protein